MGLFRRVSDIISANLNDMVDRFENPEKMLNQAVREMETRIQSAMDSAARVIANERLLAKQLADYKREHDQCHERARTAVGRDDDNSARHELVRRSELASLITALEDQHQAASESSKRLRSQISAMRVRLIEAKRKLLTLSARSKAADARKKIANELGDGCEFESSFSKFDRLATNVERSEAEADALLELSGNTTSLHDPQEDSIDAELAALKSAK